jgi:hypothetical protein
MAFVGVSTSWHARAGKKEKRKEKKKKIARLKIGTGRREK